MESPNFKRVQRRLAIFVSTETVQLAFEGYEAFVSLPAKAIDSSPELVAKIIGYAVSENITELLKNLRKETKG